MKKLPLLSTVFACLAFASFGASAAIVDHGAYLTDTTTGLDWLDLTETANMSYNMVSAELAAGGTLEGWRYATRAEVGDLWSAFGGDSNYYSGWSTQNDGLFDAIAPLMGDLYCGTVWCPEVGAGFSHWITADFASAQDVANDHHNPKVVVEGERAVAILYDYIYRVESATQDYAHLTQVTIADDFANGEFGSALVRISAIPVPAAIWLFGSGLLGIAAVARRGKA